MTDTDVGAQTAAGGLRRLKLGLGVAGVVALIAVAATSYAAWRSATDEAGWAALAEARAGDPSAEGMERARSQTRGTSAEPWASYYAALRLFEQGGKEGRVRCGQVTREALAAHSESGAAPFLQGLLATVETFESQR